MLHANTFIHYSRPATGVCQVLKVIYKCKSYMMSVQIPSVLEGMYQTYMLKKYKNCSKACFLIASMFFMTTIDAESHPPCVVQRSACIQSNFSPRKQSGDNDDYASAALTST